MERLAMVLTALGLALALAACGQADTGGDVAATDPPADLPTDSPTPTPEPTPTTAPTGPSLRTDRPTAGTRSPGGPAEITGTLGGTEIEGGCPFIEAEDGTRYEVAYPDGYEADRQTFDLRGPDGEVMASAGATVTLTGRVATDMMSFCQIGPIFQAEEVRVG
ncbi:hypothetical protein BH20ACT8_BH20ACT8_11310 [soil metagenome]